MQVEASNYEVPHTRTEKVPSPWFISRRPTNRWQIPWAQSHSTAPDTITNAPQPTLSPHFENHGPAPFLATHPTESQSDVNGSARGASVHPSPSTDAVMEELEGPSNVDAKVQAAKGAKKAKPERPADVRHELQRTFESHERTYQGSFHFNETYTTPDPALRIDGYGPITLPLAPKEARKLISHCRQATFGMGERDMVDTNVRNSWELSASKVCFEDDDLESFLDWIVSDICEALGVDRRASKPRLELHKLLVYETGSHFLPHQDTERIDGMFASVIVVLPSSFTGGDVHLSHSGKSKILNSSSSSSNKTTVLAWYSDVTHEVKLITSGYRLALSYSLIHTTKRLRPHFASPSSLVERFRQVLLLWKRRDDATPFKIMYLLIHQYSRANLRGNALKGSDAQVVTLLRGLAEELGFCLALAPAKCHMTGKSEGYNGQDLSFPGLGDDDIIDEAAVEMVEVTETNLKFKGVVDLDGHPIPGGQAMKYSKDDSEAEAIPLELDQAIYGISDYEQTVERSWVDNAGNIERWCRPSFLLIWPEVHNVELEHNGDLVPVLRALRDTREPAPTNDQQRVISYLLRAAASQRLSRDSVMESVCQAAAHWKDVDLWKKTVRICQSNGGFGSLTAINLCDAIRQLGFERIRKTVESMLRAEEDNILRFQVLNTMEDFRQSATQDIPEAWIATQRKCVLESLRKPRSDLEPSALLDVLRGPNLTNVLEVTIMPQLRTFADAKFLLCFACVLHIEMPTLGIVDHDQVYLTGLIREIVSFAVSKADVFAKQNPIDWAPHPYCRVYPVAGPGLAHLCFLACLKTGNQDLGVAISSKLRKRLEARKAGHEIKEVILPMLSLLADTLRSCPSAASIPGVLGLYKLAFRVADASDQRTRNMSVKVKNKVKSCAEFLMTGPLGNEMVPGDAMSVRSDLEELLKMALPVEL